jgi:hypothetical protein
VAPASLRSRLFNIDQEFFSKVWIFSPIIFDEATGREGEQQVRHLLPSFCDAPTQVTI